MEVGFVCMYPNAEKQPTYVLETLHALYCRVDVLYSYEHTKEDIVEHIRKSTIRKWIFSGSPADVHSTHSPQVSLDIFAIPNKDYLLICYSMESILYQLGYPVVKRVQNKKEEFVLTFPYTLCGLPNPAKLYRNHHYYTPIDSIQDQEMRTIAAYEGETMMLTYKNAILTQFHPEKTDHGKQMIFNWLHDIPIVEEKEGIF